MGEATVWDIFVIFVLLFVIFGRRLLSGAWRSVGRIFFGQGRSVSEPTAEHEAAASPVGGAVAVTEPSETPDEGKNLADPTPPVCRNEDNSGVS